MWTTPLLLFSSAFSIVVAGQALWPRQSDIVSILGPQLSPQASIVFPSSPLWTNLTERWDPYSEPTLQADVEVYTPSDVQATVKYAANNAIPLLVKNTAHGFTITVQEYVHNGIQLDIKNMNNLTLDTEKNVALAGGGVIMYQMYEALYPAQKRTGLGGCECVGLMGLGLGGGIGRMEGAYGLVADNILSVSLVLANGSLTTVSAASHPDLYWAIRGAGHNFGVVVEAEIQIYDRRDENLWVNANFYYTGDQLEDVFDLLNEMRPTQSEFLTIFTFWGASPTNATQPVIQLAMQYGGTADSFADIAQPFIGIGPTNYTQQVVAWNETPAATGNGIDDPFCLTGQTARHGHFSAMLKEFNTTALREAWSWYESFLVDYPQFAGTDFAFESYPMQAVKAVPANSTAYPFRDLNIVSLFMINYNDSSLDSLAKELGRTARGLLHAGSGLPELQVYVNYAQGDENDTVWYGAEAWRQERLHALKAEYDPAGVFDAYNPITS